MKADFFLETETNVNGHSKVLVFGIALIAFELYKLLRVVKVAKYLESSFVSVNLPFLLAFVRSVMAA